LLSKRNFEAIYKPKHPFSGGKLNKHYLQYETFIG
jgi:hypothetical protein